MDKRGLQSLLDRSRSNLRQMCDDLKLAQSTASRWSRQVPRYASFYAAAMSVMSEEQRNEVRKLADG